MGWVPVVLLAFKVLVLGIGMFYAIKWHYDRAQKEHEMDRHAVLRASGKVAAFFVLTLLCLGIGTFALGRAFGLDLTLP